jgi:hypothetical protein
MRSNRRDTPLKKLAIAAATICVALATTSAARADASCDNQTMSGGTITGNLVVMSGGCTLNGGVAIGGNVLVEPNATLTAYEPSFLGLAATVAGNVSIGHGGSAKIFGVTIGGDVSVGQGGFADISSSEITGSVRAYGCGSVILSSGPTNAITVGGNVLTSHCATVNMRGDTGIGLAISGNFRCAYTSNTCWIIRSTIEGNVQVIDNPGDSIVGGSTIGGNLRCHGNANSPLFNSSAFGTNSVAGYASGQCAGAAANHRLGRAEPACRMPGLVHRPDPSCAPVG